MNYGYIRYFENDKDYYRQLFELRKQGCQIIYTEDSSSQNDQSSKLDKLCNELLDGDTVVVWKIDQFGATQSQQVKRLIELGIKKVKFKSVYENIDTSSDTGYEKIKTITSLRNF